MEDNFSQLEEKVLHAVRLIQDLKAENSQLKQQRDAFEEKMEALRKEHNKQLKLKERRGEPYKHGGWNISPQLILARAVGVTKKAVDNWLDGIKHPCNINVDKILHIASDYDQDRVLHILEEDLFSHQYSLGIFRDSLANYSYPLAENWGVPTKKEEAVV